MDSEPPKLSQEQKLIILIVIIILFIAVSVFLSIGNATT
jgi:hypothetical protein